MQYIPYIWGILFLGEPFSILRICGLTLILGGMVLSNLSNSKTKKMQIIMCAAVFILNGFVSVLSKLHQIEAVYPVVNAAEFVMLGGIFKFILDGIMYLITQRRNDGQNAKKFSIFIMLLVAASAVVGGVSYLMQLLGASSVPTTVLYPFVTGGSIVFSTVAGIVLFKEKISKNLILGVGLCFVGTILFL